MTTNPPLPLRSRPLPPIARRVLGSAVLEALTTPHGVSRYLEQVSPAWSLDPATAVISEVAPQPDAVTLTLRRATPAAPHRAGQHVRLSVEVGGRSLTRCYSITDAEGADPLTVRLTVRTHGDGTVSRHLANARPGTVVRLSQPAGRFVLPAQRPDRVVLVSGGSGITPVLSMLRTLVDEGHRGRVTFLHYARSADAVLHTDDLADLADRGVDVRVATAFTREDAGGLTGHLTRDHLDAVAPDWREATFFACGPFAMLDRLQAILDDEGIALHREQFTAPAPSVIDLDGVAVGATTFAASGVTTDNDGATLLEQAEAAGLSPEFGCRMGICHTCTRRLTCGPVRDVRTGEVSDEPDRDVQLCVNSAVGDVEIDL